MNSNLWTTYRTNFVVILCIIFAHAISSIYVSDPAHFCRDVSPWYFRLAIYMFSVLDLLFWPNADFTYTISVNRFFLNFGVSAFFLRTSKSTKNSFLHLVLIYEILFAPPELIKIASLHCFDNWRLYRISDAIDNFFFWIYAAISFIILVVERRKQRLLERTIDKNFDLLEISIA
ncbi:hypothetical protein PRIPAC_72909 [Pristionchus pacificus]|uniref:Uncharacterized protein n=1 Tax=Pristionchus pacificus TaxID=54126 RepID=A0A2A6C6U0_PRIPA|nr:hypothetical protein PRIPAC_72909 [Pristionchus pacificus]|eukprot:PDM73830.1 hypothetical protein PRIPAC_41186 [Pristionchus pacificus]